MRLPLLNRSSAVGYLIRRSISRFEDAPCKVEKLENRSLIKVYGAEASSFLQGLITNDMRHLEEGALSMYCMFLNTKGRVIFDSIIYGESKESFLVECDKKAEAVLKKHLTMYKVRRKIGIETCDYPVLAAFGTSVEESVKALAKENSSLVICRDPRIKQLGFRILLKGGEHPRCTSGDYKMLRMSLGVGEGVEELPSGNCFPLEANCDYLHGVSFHKGCYIGQELTARTHHTGVVRKRLMPVFFEPTQKLPAFDSPITDPSGKNVGKLRGASEAGIGVALLRVAEVLKEAENLTIGNLKLKTKRPEWWPSEVSKDKPVSDQ
ncbi:putative transferase CAF17 homolog, mitochondrial [Cloeon dipterum]|uniref:putative transferase CAF17 homolog, mitochondrial n=1 Tax=Cloeon dipterum TaxID=197152 RepID=UPI00321F8BE1